MGRVAPKKYDKMDWNERQSFNDTMMERYGLDRIDNGEEMTGRGSYDTEAENAAIARAMANDYDTRRSIESAQMSGNEKANALGKGISNISEAVDAERFMAKTHKNRIGNTGKYSSANDEAGVADYWSNKDRNKQNNMFASKDDLSSAMSVENQMDAAKPYKESESLTKAKERVQAWESSQAGSNPSPYGNRSF